MRYHANGNTTRIGGAARTFVYDNSNRMSQTRVNGSVRMNYVYNGKGEQVRRYLGTANTYTVHDEAGHWLGDYNTAGAPIQQAIWLDDLPVGVVADKLYSIEPDHLGSPRAIIDPTRNVAVWRWDLNGEAFGNTAPNQDPDGDSTAFVFNLRYPGQRYDAASGLNYNYFRDYDASTGRYMESDPIGLKGGSSTYGYVLANPMTQVDTRGLMSFGPTCSNGQKTAIISAIVELANEIQSRAIKRCQGEECDFSLASRAMRFLSGASFSCDLSYACATTTMPNFVYFYPPYLNENSSLRTSGKEGCGCLKSALFHEAVHYDPKYKGMSRRQEETSVRRDTMKCVSCAGKYDEDGSRL